MHNFVYLAQRRSQEFFCEPNFGGVPFRGGGGRAPAPWLHHCIYVDFNLTLVHGTQLYGGIYMCVSYSEQTARMQEWHRIVIANTQRYVPT